MKILKIILILLTISLAVSFVALLPTQIKIESISCSSQYGPCNEEILKNLDSNIGKSLRDSKKEIAKGLEAQSLINDFSIQFKLPSNLHVNIVEKKPQFAIYSLDTNSFYLTDKEGHVVKIEAANNLPYVKTGNFNAKIGDTVNERYLFALDLTYRLFSGYQIKETEITDNSIIAIMPEGIKVIFPTEGDKDVLLGGLSMIMSRLNESVKESKIDISQIDLRFKNPVLK